MSSLSHLFFRFISLLASWLLLLLPKTWVLIFFFSSSLDVLCCGHQIVKPTFSLFLFRTWVLSSSSSSSFSLPSSCYLGSAERRQQETFFFFYFFFREGNYVKDGRTRAETEEDVPTILAWWWACLCPPLEEEKYRHYAIENPRHGSLSLVSLLLLLLLLLLKLAPLPDRVHYTQPHDSRLLLCYCMLPPLCSSLHATHIKYYIIILHCAHWLSKEKKKKFSSSGGSVTFCRHAASPLFFFPLIATRYYYFSLQVFSWLRASFGTDSERGGGEGGIRRRWKCRKKTFPLSFIIAGSLS